MTKDGRGEHQNTQSCVQSKVPLSIFSRTRAAVQCFLYARFVQRLSGLLSPWVKLSLPTGLVTPVTRSHSPAWVCAPRGCAGGTGTGRGCTGSQPAMWGPVHPKRRTWTSRNRGWCPLVSRTCSEGSGRVRNWCQPRMCTGRLCSMFLPKQSKSDFSSSKRFHLIWRIISPRCRSPAPHCPSVVIEGIAPYGKHLTSHEEEKSGDILHQIMFLAAAQHAYDPAEQDDWHGHAYETGGHPFEICKDNIVVLFNQGPWTTLIPQIIFKKKKEKRQWRDSRRACHSSCLIVLVRLIGKFLGSADDE